MSLCKRFLGSFKNKELHCYPQECKLYIQQQITDSPDWHPCLCPVCPQFGSPHPPNKLCLEEPKIINVAHYKVHQQQQPGSLACLIGPSTF